MQKRDFETYQKRLQDFKISGKIFRDPRFRGTIRHPFICVHRCQLMFPLCCQISLLIGEGTSVIHLC